MDYNKFKVEELKEMIDSIGLLQRDSKYYKDSLIAILKEFGDIPEIKYLNRLDTYDDWTNGGEWIKVMIYRFVEEATPEFEYDNDYSNCDCDDICRCGTITNIRIDTKNSNWRLDMVKNSLSNMMNIEETPNGISKIGKYIIFRTLSLMIRDIVDDIFDSNYLLEAGGVGGYYGEEFYSNSHIRCCLYNRLEKGITLKELLKIEYGFDLKPNITFEEVLEIDPKEIIIPNMNHFDKCLKEDIYSWYNGIVGICFKSNNKYTLKDGYHRLASAYQRQKVWIIVANFTD